MEMKLIIRWEMGIPQWQICKLIREVILSNLPFNFVASIFPLIMNMLIWNCWGALSPTFCTNASDLVRVYSPAIMIVIETKVSGDKAKRIAKRLPLDGAIFANSIGFSSGLWVLWDSNQVDVIELSSTEQEIHAIISSTSKPSRLLFVVYGSPRFAKIHLLWDNLKSVAGLHSMPWVIEGDFNEVLMGKDKSGGRPISLGKALLFQECLDTCKMIDIGFSSPRYTWSNHRPLAHLVQERIDRVFVNAEWNGIHLEAVVFHLEKTHSDHCPVKLCLDNNRNFHPPRPFRFQPMWLSHPSFSRVVRDA
ncbi:hypothetical protein SO802_015025 [Lithocarpus litseifolius]|uniref:Endonuclease/exonuclease/phosphatase domain-containing protein n=1 Tax=Lithocarpus litseifolius TaxID=425828 RepID=A0AAW2CT67_9ROSI